MKRLLIDLMKCRECSRCKDVYEFYNQGKYRGVKNIIELALFTTTCRRCEDAPCINVCPEEALEKDKNGMVKRNNNLCIGCKSCALACPFGTIMNHIVDYHTRRATLCQIDEEKDYQQIIRACPHKAIQVTDEEPAQDKHIYQLTDKVMILDYNWEEFIK